MLCVVRPKPVTMFPVYERCADCGSRSVTFPTRASGRLCPACLNQMRRDAAGRFMCSADVDRVVPQLRLDLDGRDG